jgi:hypothetical protein
MEFTEIPIEDICFANQEILGLKEPIFPSSLPSCYSSVDYVNDTKQKK